MAKTSVIAILRQPHPTMSSRGVLLTAFALGLGISTILAVFQPFGLYQVPDGWLKMVIMGGYGIITFLVVVCNGMVLPALFPTVYSKERWTLGKDLLLEGAINFFMAGICNLLYSNWVFQLHISIQTFLFFQAVTICVGLLPFSVMMLLRHIQLLNRNVQEAGKLNTGLEAYHHKDDIQPPASIGEERLMLVADNGLDTFEVPTAAFVYAESADNYVKIYYEKDGQLCTDMLRLTLKKLETYTSGNKRIVRCHRAYVVNLQHVTSFSGNAQGLKLEMKNDPELLIPVSRSMVPVIRELLAIPG